MAVCTKCNVNHLDRHCTNTTRYCYVCCTERDDILTCPRHFNSLGHPAAAARRATGMVHPSILDPPGESDPPDGPPAELPSSNLPTERIPSAPDLLTEATPAVQATSSLPPPTPAAVVSHPASSASVAAMRAEMDTIKAAAEVREAALRAQLDRQAADTRERLDKQAADTRRILAMLEARHTPPPPAGAVASNPPPPSDPTSIPTPAPVLAPHRAAVLDRTAALATINLYEALSDADSNDDAQEVPPQSHTRTQPSAVLPAAFVPISPGTEHSAGQQLAAIFKEFSKQGGKVKYATIKELDEALDDWADDSLRLGWTAAQIESIRAYQRLLIIRFSFSERRPFKEILEYHNKWCKAVHSKTIDMFAAGAELNLAILYEVSHPKQYGGGTAAATAGHKAGRSKDATSTAINTAAKRGAPAAAKYPAGSCTHHPTSTSHTTAECIKKS
jgi:hypothetical protein